MGLVFMILIVPINGFSQNDSNKVFSDETSKTFFNFRVDFGYDAVINETSDIIFICWAILRDQGESNVTWNSVRVDSIINENNEKIPKSEQNTTQVELEKNYRIKKTLVILTPVEDLTNGKLEVNMTFSFTEVGVGDQDITLTSNPTNTDAPFVGLIILGLIVLGIRRNSKNKK